MSNHKGGGMASKERLYELWMLYYTKVSVSAEAPTVTPVVAAGLLPEVTNTSRETHDGSPCVLSLSLVLNGHVWKWSVFRCLLTKWRRLPCATGRGSCLIIWPCL